jgi:hypothetical protein
MMRLLRNRLLFFAVLSLTACEACHTAEPPDNYSVERLTDPYEKIPAPGAVNNLERAVAAVDFTAKQLGYGDIPARVLRIRSQEQWMRGLVLLLNSGTTGHLGLAWEGLLENIVTNDRMPADIKFKTRQAEGRVNDYVNTKQPEDVLRREYIAEITWTLYMLAQITPDSGFKAP